MVLFSILSPLNLWTKCLEPSKIKLLTSVTGQGNSILIQGQGRHIIIFHFLCLLKADPNLLHQSCYSSRISKSKDCSSLVRHIPASCFPESFICLRKSLTWKEVLQTTRQSEAKQRGVFSASLLIQKQSSQVKTQFLHFLHHKEKGKGFLPISTIPLLKKLKSDSRNGIINLGILEATVT